MSYASFWKRTAAYLVDSLIFGVLFWVFLFIAAVIWGIARGGAETSPLAMLLLIWVFEIVCFFLYYVWPESSSWQATIGKKIFGLKVTDSEGNRISFLRAFGRYFGMFISWMIFGIGILMCLWTEKKQCLHDQMAGCLVLDTTPDQKQGCAIGLVAGYILFILGLMGLAVALPQFAMAKERVKMTEAVTTLKKAHETRGELTSVNVPFKGWDQMHNSLDCQVQDNHRLCVNKDFTYELTDNEIKAIRNAKDKYILSIGLTGNINCSGQNDYTRRLCRIGRKF